MMNDSRYKVPKEIHAELMNWSRWCHLGDWPHPLPDDRCGSAERDFHAEWHSEEESAPEPPRIRPNERQAREVQRVWESMAEFDERGHLIRRTEPGLVLKAEYPGKQGSREQAAHALCMTLTEYESHLRWAVGKVEAAFVVCA